MKSDIAIIGMSGRFPEAKDLREFYENLRSGHSASRPVSLKRKCNTTLDLQENYRPLSYIEDIDVFDHRFFNISLDEAEQMDPRQRILLEEVYRTFESSAYPVSYFSNSNTAVFIADTDLDYYRHAQSFSPVLFTGNLAAATAGRIARHFKLRGAALMVDTACSSSLVAVHLACKELLSKDADLAIAGSTSLTLFPRTVNSVTLGVSSADGKTCSFSADASGSGAGEAVTCVLLKRLVDAQRDNDLIYATIKGTAVNQDAHLSGSLTAPSSTAQKEVILRAWENAGIDPRTISYVECHGSATPLGDPIEIEGLTKAFQSYTSDKQFCAVSSVKSNIGHTGSSAGLAGLIKVVLSLQRKELLPSINFSSPNPLIDFANSAVVVNNELKQWRSDNGHPLRAGLSSFGLSGTNCHVVIEELQQKPVNRRDESRSLVFTISGKSKEALLKNRQALAEYLASENCDPFAVSYTLACGKDHYAYRMGYVEADLHRLADRLMKPNQDEVFIRRDFERLVLLFDQEFKFDAEALDQYTEISPAFKKHFKKCASLVPHHQRTTGFYHFAFQYAFYHVLTGIGIQTDDLLGVGIGRIVTEVLTEELILSEGVNKALQFNNQTIENLSSKIESLVAKEIAAPAIFLNIGSESGVTAVLQAIEDSKRYSEFRIITIPQLDQNTVPLLLKNLYLSGFPVKWGEALADVGPTRIQLPSYQFDSIRCWLKAALKPVEGTETRPQITTPKITKEVTETVSPDRFPTEWSSTEKSIAAIWTDLLKLNEISLEDDFFMLGGQSLYAIQMMNRIQDDFRVELGFKNTFQWSTVRQLADQIDRLLQDNSVKVVDEIMPIAVEKYYDVSRNQARLWFLDQFDEEKFNYILSFFKVIDGKLKRQYLEMAFEAMVRRHESLRTVFISIDGVPKQKVLTYEELGFKMEYIDLENAEGNKDELVKELVDCESLMPIDLEKGPLLRVKLIRLDEEKHIYIASVHHIMCDGWSIDIMEGEVQALYTAFSKNLKSTFEPLKIHYKDYSAWSNRLLTPERLKRHKAYWMEHLKGKLPESEFPLDFPRTVSKTWKGKNRVTIMDAEQSKQLIELAHRYKASFFMVVFAAVKALHFRYTHQSDIILGTTVSSRNELNLENQIGFYTSTVPIRTVFDPECTFEDLLKAVITNLLASFDHQWYPFDQLVKDLRITRTGNRYPLFNILVALRNTDALQATTSPQANEDSISIHNYADVEFPISKYDLTIRIAKEEGDRISFYIEHNTQLYKTSTMELLTERLMLILSEVIVNPAIKIKDIPLTNTDEQLLMAGSKADVLFSNEF